MNELIQNKLVHYYLNLDYNYCDIEQQTNLLISQTINKFINKYEKDFNNKIFVYEFNDDLPSLIGYIILNNIQGVKSNFKFTLTKKPRKTKKYFKRKEKISSNRFIKKNRDKIIYISPFNFIYKVVEKESSSKKIITPNYCPNFQIIKDFTFDELLCAKNFYQIEEIKKDQFTKGNLDLLSYSNFIKNINCKFNINILNLLFVNEPKFILVWLCGDSKKDMEILQEIEDTNNIVLYNYQGAAPALLTDSVYNFSLKRTTNRPNQNYGNINNLKLIRELNLNQVEFLGDWPQQNKEIVLKLIGGTK